MERAELERNLNALARELEWPPTPAFDELVLEPRDMRERRRRTRPLVLALAALVLGIAIAFAVPPARSAILRFLHLRGVTIERVHRLPPAEERDLRATLGAPATRAAAERYVGFRILLPANERETQLYIRDQTVSMLLEKPEPALLTEFRAGGPTSLFVKKLAGAGTRIEPVEIDGAPGYWLTGAPHVVLEPQAPPRLAGNVLLWERGGVTLRLEGKLAKSDAIDLAASIR
jgi:hypothetical protein